MFCATFYSYKGGVGRTLALANVAAALVKRNKKVLVVDFDLEAPGLSTLEIFNSAQGKVGILEFIHEYLSTGIVPDASEYIHECHIVEDDTGNEYKFPISVMPAGAEAEYPDRFSSIDWATLYSNRDGFLLTEDLREQWREQGFDYVLIDSRTGLTDVGGICTRQLPDAVVFVFFPNEQNLVGLKEVAQTVAASTARDREIERIYVASRLPRLDDEHGVLKKWLKKFQDVIDYDDDQLVKVDHYDSLSLLDQTVFSISRPKTELARQYENIANALARLNVEDADGAVDFIESVIAGRNPHGSQAAAESRDQAIRDKLDRIGQFHKRDYVVQYHLARVFYFEWREYDKAGLFVNLGLKAIGSTSTSAELSPSIPSRLHQLRIRISSALEDDDAVHRSALAILDDVAAQESAVLDSLLAIARIGPTGIPAIGSFAALAKLSPTQLVAMARRLSAAPNAMQIAADIGEFAVKDGRLSEISQNDAFELANTLIAGKKFDCALAVLELVGEDQGIQSVGKQFNAAMAQWGRDGHPPRDRFAEVIEIAGLPIDYQEDPNFNQCIALCYAVIGDAERCRSHLDLIPTLLDASDNGREFSCWSYTGVTRVEFETHCAEISLYSSTGTPSPIVFR